MHLKHLAHDLSIASFQYILLIKLIEWGERSELCGTSNIIVNYVLLHLKSLPLESQKKVETSQVLLL